MTCADWPRLEAAGDRLLLEGSSERRQALEHAESCASCDRRLRRVDPSMAVSRLAAAPATRSEIDTIKRNVGEMRRLREVEKVSRPRRRMGGRLAAVAVLTVAILTIAEDTDDRTTDRGSRQLPAGVAAVAAPTAVAAPPASRGSLLSEDYRLYGSLPLVESIDPSEARVYQLGREDFSLVWIVDESIEVVAPTALTAPIR